MSSATVALQLNRNASVRLAASTSPALTSPVYSPSSDTANRRATLTVTGLAAGTRYYYGVEINGAIDTGLTGTFRTLDASATTLTVAFAGDANTNFDGTIYDAIRAEDPAFFLH